MNETAAEKLANLQTLQVCAENQEINIAIAEECPTIVGLGADGIYYLRTGLVEFDPCNDLNAMHEAENRLTSFQRAKHGKILQDLLNEHAVGFVPSYDRDFASLSRIASATARQRAEAFLRTIGKWKEDAK